MLLLTYWRQRKLKFVGFATVFDGLGDKKTPTKTQGLHRLTLSDDYAAFAAALLRNQAKTVSGELSP